MNILYVNSLEASNKELARQLASCQAALADTEALEIGTGERLAKVEKQLAAAIAACKLKDEALESWGSMKTTEWLRIAAKALAIQPDDSTLRAWLGEPVAWRTFDGEGGYDFRSYDDNEDYRSKWDARNPNHKSWVELLYSPKGLK